MYLPKALNAGGLALLAGPLSLVLAMASPVTAYAQEYVDLEAERAAQATGTRATPPADPYGGSPATAYPATSYGVNSAPAPVATSPPGQVQQSQGQGQNLSNLFYQIQQLQQEVMMLNGKVEEQAHELRSLKEQSLERYIDLDRRLAGGAATASATTTAGTGSSAVPVAVTPVSDGNVAEQPGEGDAYRSAYSLVRNQRFDDATSAFKAFLQDYPAGKYAPNAHYWLGELYLVVQPADLESSRQAFMLLLSQYPDNSKAPDAMYKLGKVYFMKGNREKAREYLDRVISQYGSTNSSAVKLSRDFIAENY